MKKKKILIGSLIVAVLAAAGIFAYQKLSGGENALGGAVQMSGMPGMQGGMSGGSAGGVMSGTPGNASGGRQGSSGVQGANTSQSAAYAIVKAAVPAKGDVSVTSSLVGTVTAEDMVYIYSKASGDVISVLVKAGDYVEEGQLICEIDTDQVESAKNQMESAQISLNSAESTLSRMRILYRGGDITDQEYEQYNNNVKSAQIQFDNARLNYERQLDYSSVKAPIAGRIESCSVSVYDHVSNNAELCVITGEGESRIDFYVSERMMKNLKEGDALEIVKNGTVYPGKIREISTIVDSATGLFRCRGSMEETDEIAIGSSVMLRLVTEKAVGAMTVPVDAIYYSGSKAYVYVVEDGVAYMRRVQVGLYDSELAEIRDGLDGSELVVGTWSSNLYDGARVRLLDELQQPKAAQ